MKWEPNLKTTREPWNCGNASRRDGFVAHRLVPLWWKTWWWCHCNSILNTILISHHNRIYLLRMKVNFFSKEKHFCPNQPHHPRCRTSSGVHWAFLDIGALSGGPWIFHVKFCPGLRENAEMSVIKISLLQNLPSFSQKFQLFSVMFCPF